MKDKIKVFIYSIAKRLKSFWYWEYFDRSMTVVGIIISIIGSGIGIWLGLLSIHMAQRADDLHRYSERTALRATVSKILTDSGTWGERKQLGSMSNLEAYTYLSRFYSDILSQSGNDYLNSSGECKVVWEKLRNLLLMKTLELSSFSGEIVDKETVNQINIGKSKLYDVCMNISKTTYSDYNITP